VEPLRTEFKKKPSRTRFLRTNRINQRKEEMVKKRNKFTENSRHPAIVFFMGIWSVLSWKERLDSLSRRSLGLLMGSFLSCYSKEQGKEQGGIIQLSHHKQSSILLDGTGLTII